MKKLLSIIFTMALLISFNIFQINDNRAYAQDIFITIDGIEFDKDKGEITDYTGSGTTVNIPSMIEGISVTSIGSYAFAFSSDDLISIILPSSIISIGDSAFSYCNGLTSIIIPENTLSIGNYAFSSCDGLTNIRIPANISSIGFHAFRFCESLTDINVEVGNSFYKSIDGVLYDKTGLTLIKYPENKSGALYNIPNTVKTIADYAFYNADIISINIPIGVLSIGDSTFYSCNNLASLVIPDTVTNIDEEAFYNCDSLLSIVIGEDVASIGDRAFVFCSKLANITIPSSVTTIGDGVFSFCDGLTSINVDDSSGSYKSQNGVLFSKTMATLIKFPDNKILSSYSIPSEVTSIAYRAFYYNKYITNITIPTGVINIGKEAFSQSESLKTVLLSSSVTSLGKEVFAYCDKLSSIIVDSNNGSYKSIDDILFNKAGTILMLFPQNKNLTTYNVPYGVMSISESAFYSSNYLRTIVLPSSVASIEAFAFSYNKLEKIVIPESVTSIDDYAFSSFSDDLVIYGVAGSHAQIFANNSGIMFVANGGVLPNVTPIPIPVIINDSDNRLMGNSRTGTAVDISAKGWDAGSVDCVFVTAGWSFPDALAAVPLAYAYDAPILMVNSDKNSLSNEAIAEIKRLNPSTVYILGGTGAVGSGIETQLAQNGFSNTERIAGNNRQATAVDIAIKLKSKLGTTNTAFLVNGWNYPDALGSAPAAAINGYPILFSRNDSVPADTLNALVSLGITKIFILGGNMSVSNTVYNQLSATYSLERISGDSRVDTALEIQKRFFPESGSYKYVFASTAYNYADALTGGVLAARAGCPMVLVKNTLPIPTAVKDYINNTECEKVIIFGGSNAVSDAVKNDVSK